MFGNGRTELHRKSISYEILRDDKVVLLYIDRDLAGITSITWITHDHLCHKFTGFIDPFLCMQELSTFNVHSAVYLVMVTQMSASVVCHGHALKF